MNICILYKRLILLTAITLTVITAYAQPEPEGRTLSLSRKAAG